MNPEIKTEWIERLTNGERKQGRAFLNNKTAGTYCCLGVLCEMAEEAGVITSTIRSAEDPDNSGKTIEVADYENFYAILPREVAVWAGLDYSKFGSVGHIKAGSLAGMNDDGKSFEEIAKVIEENL